VNLCDCSATPANSGWRRAFALGEDEVSDGFWRGGEGGSVLLSAPCLEDREIGTIAADGIGGIAAGQGFQSFTPILWRLYTTGSSNRVCAWIAATHYVSS
jgi:hypothetical protein